MIFQSCSVLAYCGWVLYLHLRQSLGVDYSEKVITVIKEFLWGWVNPWTVWQLKVARGHSQKLEQQVLSWKEVGWPISVSIQNQIAWVQIVSMLIISWWFWTNYITSVSFGFLTCKMGVSITYLIGICEIPGHNSCKYIIIRKNPMKLGNYFFIIMKLD